MLVPNLLSVSRIPLAGLLWIAPERPAWTLSVLFVAGLTDVLDGWLVRRIRARRIRERDPGSFAAHSARGAFIDGFADKVFGVSAIVLLAVTLRPEPWLLAMLAMREILFIPLMLAYRLSPEDMRARVDFTADRLGKFTTFAQFTALVLGLLQHPLFAPAAILTGVVGVIATVTYAHRAFSVQTT